MNKGVNNPMDYFLVWVFSTTITRTRYNKKKIENTNYLWKNTKVCQNTVAYSTNLIKLQSILKVNACLMLKNNFSYQS